MVILFYSFLERLCFFRSSSSDFKRCRFSTIFISFQFVRLSLGPIASYVFAVRCTLSGLLFVLFFQIIQFGLHVPSSRRLQAISVVACRRELDQFVHHTTGQVHGSWPPVREWWPAVDRDRRSQLDRPRCTQVLTQVPNLVYSMTLIISTEPTKKPAVGRAILIAWILLCKW